MLPPISLNSVVVTVLFLHRFGTIGWGRGQGWNLVCKTNLATAISNGSFWKTLVDPAYLEGTQKIGR